MCIHKYYNKKVRKIRFEKNFSNKFYPISYFYTNGTEKSGNHHCNHCFLHHHFIFHWNLLFTLPWILPKKLVTLYWSTKSFNIWDRTSSSCSFHSFQYRINRKRRYCLRRRLRRKKQNVPRYSLCIKTLTGQIIFFAYKTFIVF